MLLQKERRHLARMLLTRGICDTGDETKHNRGLKNYTTWTLVMKDPIMFVIVHKTEEAQITIRHVNLES